MEKNPWLLLVLIGSDKGKIYGGLAKIIFTDHPKYGAAYSSNPKKFRDAVGSRITTYVLLFFCSTNKNTKFYAVSGTNTRRSKCHLAARALG